MAEHLTCGTHKIVKPELNYSHPTAPPLGICEQASKERERERERETIGIPTPAVPVAHTFALAIFRFESMP